VGNVALLLRFLGTSYHGWQLQKEDDTVCRRVMDALARTVGHPVALCGCGRTDAGVHALRYVANFKAETAIPMDRLPLALNTRLPEDIAVLKAARVPERFNAIGSLERKEYTYRILNRPHRDPMYLNRAFFYPHRLDREAMKRAARAFVGTHDFKALQSSGGTVKTTVRTVHYCELLDGPDTIDMRVCANGFLYNMVRAMAGTLIYAGRGKIDPAEIGDMLNACDRRLLGPTAPPGGLYMSGLWYAEGVSAQWTNA